MDKQLFLETISLLKYLKYRKIIIQIIKLTKLTKKQSKALAYKDKKSSVGRKIQTDNKLLNNYSMEYAPTLHYEIFSRLILEQDLKKCLELTCKYNIPYLKVAALFLIYFKENDIKFLSAAVQTSRKLKFRKFSLLGSKLLAKYCSNGYEEFMNLVRNDDYELSEEYNIIE
ncbi:hypothetical protein H312_01057 [Anncaliia algerae PRA339]|uniref:Uncharacterized protein n=2 Tax=Anncaliia algerae PRA339 TaxID=1288291 RepID=A0A059F3A6_9MICR|nr:hypothetical protein H312_01057 [Anncaliia algerae PRA339]